jgi:sulfite oxidase
MEARGARPPCSTSRARWSWRLWEAELELDAGPTNIVARAWDSALAAQPEDPTCLWNPKGYVNNSWARITVSVT